MKKLLFTFLIISFNSFAVGIGPENQIAPGYVRAMVYKNPAHNITIGWNAYDGRSQDSVLYYDKVNHGMDLKKYAHKVKPTTRNIYKGMNNNFVRLSNLEESTKYYFVIENSYGSTRQYFFETLSNDPNQKLSIIAGGDSRNNKDIRRNANRLVAKLRPHLVLFGGDMTNLGFSSSWQKWMRDWQYTISKDGRVTALVVARGNHERKNEWLEKMYDTPKGVYYAFSVGGDLLRVYTLNSEATVSGTQTDWLISDLKNSQKHNWRIAQYHKPMRPHVADKKEGDTIYNNWAKAFYKLHMNLVMESDSHTVKVTYPVKPEWGADDGFTADMYNGTVYAGEGCWGAPIRPANDWKTWTRSWGSFNQFKWIFVTKNKMEMRTVKVDNAKSVESVKPNDIFTAPKGLKVWKPREGAVVNIYPQLNWLKKQKKNTIKKK